MDHVEKDSHGNHLKWFLSNPLEGMLCLLLIAIVGVTFIQVLFRYIFHFSLAWSEELARYLFLWLAALTSAYAFKKGSHFALRFLVNRFGMRMQRILGGVVVMITSGFLIIFTWKAIEYTISMAGQIAPSTGLSMAVPYSSGIAGGLLMLNYVIKNWLKELRQSSRESET